MSSITTEFELLRISSLVVTEGLPARDKVIKDSNSSMNEGDFDTLK